MAIRKKRNTGVLMLMLGIVNAGNSRDKATKRHAVAYYRIGG